MSNSEQGLIALINNALFNGQLDSDFRCHDQSLNKDCRKFEKRQLLINL